MPTLHLNLKRQWFDMIASGEKREEYRAISPYWNRVFGSYVRIKGKNYHPSDVVVCFSNGYAKDRPQVRVKLRDLRVREGRPEWGAEPGVQYYCLILGEIITE